MNRSRSVGAPGSGLDDAPRVQDAQRVERGLDRAHHAHGVGAALDLEPVAPGDADAVLGGDRAAEVERGAVEVLPTASVIASAVGSSRSNTRSGWRLPSPAWPNVPIRTSCFAAISSIARSMSGTRDARHADVLHLHRRRAARARSARARRAWRSQSASCGVGGADDVGRAGRLAGGLGARRARRPRRRRAGPTRSSASPPPSRSSPRWFMSSTARDREPVEQLEGDRLTARRPAIPATASPAASSVGKKASIVERGGGAGRSRRVASVMRPSVPWQPTNRCVSE